MQHAVLDDVGLDALLRGDLDDLVHGREHLPLHADGRTPAVRGGVAAGLPGQLGGEPAAVAPRGAEAGELLLQDRDAQVRLVTLEVVRRPQRGQAAADEGHVHVEVARQRRPPRGQPDVAVPERDLAVGERHRPIVVHRPAGRQAAPGAPGRPAVGGPPRRSGQSVLAPGQRRGVRAGGALDAGLEVVAEVLQRQPGEDLLLGGRALGAAAAEEADRPVQQRGDPVLEADDVDEVDAPATSARR